MFTALVLGLVMGALPQPARPTDCAHAGLPASSMSAHGRSSSTVRERSGPVTIAVRTPMTAASARLCLALAHHVVTGRAPSERSLALLLAQWALETGRGEQMYGYNFGGLKANTGGVDFATRESHGRAERQLVQRFRTYATAMDGAVDFIQTLANEFPLAFVVLKTGFVTNYVDALMEDGYFTGDPARYRRAIDSLAKEYRRTFDEESDTDSP
jgi:flagellum-specific peptidoglycan hydrolase FlgJ